MKQKSLSGMKAFASTRSRNHLRDAIEEPSSKQVVLTSNNAKQFAQIYGFPEDLMENLFKIFGITSYSLPELETEFKRSKFLTDVTHIMGFASLKDPPNILPELKPNAIKLPIPKDFNFNNLKKFRNIIPSLLGKDKIDLVLLPNNTIFNLENFINLLEIIYTTYPKIEDAQILMLPKPDLPVFIQFKDYELMIAPRIEEEEEEEEEEIEMEEEWSEEERKKIRAEAELKRIQKALEKKEFSEEILKECITIDQLFWIGSLSPSVFGKAKEFAKAERIYNIREQFRFIRRTITNIAYPETIQDLGEYEREMRELIDRKIAEMLSQLGKDTDKKINKNVNFNYRVGYDPIKAMEEILVEYETTSKKKTDLQSEIIKNVKQAFIASKKLKMDLQEKLNTLKSKFIATETHKELQEKIDSIHWWSGWGSFWDTVQNQFPDINWEYQTAYHLYVPEKDIKRFTRLVNDYSGLIALEKVKKEKIYIEKSRIRTLLGNATNELQNLKHTQKTVNSLLHRSKHPDIVSKYSNQLYDIRQSIAKIEDKINTVLEKEGFTRTSYPEVYKKIIPYGEVLFDIRGY